MPMKGSHIDLLLLLAVLATISSAKAAPPPVADIGFCKPYTWLSGGWVAPPRIPLLGDVNGDGYADFLYASPQDKSIDVSLNGLGWKPLRGKRLLSNLPQPIQAMCLGRCGGKGLDLIVLCKGGGPLKGRSSGTGDFSTPTTPSTVNGMTDRTWLRASRV